MIFVLKFHIFHTEYSVDVTYFLTQLTQGYYKRAKTVTILEQIPKHYSRGKLKETLAWMVEATYIRYTLIQACNNVTPCPFRGRMHACISTNISRVFIPVSLYLTCFCKPNLFYPLTRVLLRVFACFCLHKRRLRFTTNFQTPLFIPTILSHSVVYARGRKIK